MSLVNLTNEAFSIRTVLCLVLKKKLKLHEKTRKKKKKIT